MCEYNQLKEDEVVSAGTLLLLKPVEEVSKKLVPEIKEIQSSHKGNRTTEINNSHEVQQGEGLYAISKKYGVSVSTLKDWNNLKSDNLQIGEVLIISK